jgi:hypothetical protein
LIKGSKHGLQLDANNRGEVRIYADALFEGWKKTSKRHAQCIEAGSKLFTSKDTLRVSEESPGGGQSRGLGEQLHTRAHLRGTRSVTHYACKLARDELRLRGRWIRCKRRNQHGQDKGPQGSEPFLFHFRFTSPALS